jgi:uncharacterized protein YukE
MTSTGYEVEPDQLRVLSKKVFDAADAARDAYTARADRLALTEGRGDGWAAVQALEDAAEKWDAYARALQGSISRLGTQLVCAALTYDNAEDSARRAFRRG